MILALSVWTVAYKRFQIIKIRYYWSSIRQVSVVLRRKEEWKDYSPVEINLDEFLDDWVEDLKSDDATLFI